ncbi:MAG: GntR family transcriptional regulator [Spirochaetia bacterium]|nr:GntR family transcriptional regulator [Spirochaetia bacterium]
MFKHSVVYNSIKEKIVIGGWYEGMLIPSESQLCEMYDVSRITIRRALKELEYSGFVKRIQGKGTFVKASNRDPIEVSSSHESEDSITYEVVECKSVAADSVVARKLQIGDFEEVLYLRRIRYRGNVAEAYIETWCTSISPNQIKTHDLKNEKMLNIISNIKNELIDASVSTVSPIIPEDWVCKIINAKPSSAQALLNRVSTNTEGVPCEYTKAIINSDDVEFAISSWIKKDSYKGI